MDVPISRKPVKGTSIHTVSSYGGAFSSRSALRWVKWFWRSIPLLLQCTFNPSFFSLLLSFSKNGKQISGWGFDERSHGFSQSSYNARPGLGPPGPEFQETRKVFEQTSGQCSDWTWRWTVAHQDYPWVRANGRRIRVHQQRQSDHDSRSEDLFFFFSLLRFEFSLILRF